MPFAFALALVVAGSFTGAVFAKCSDRCPPQDSKAITELLHCVDNLPNPVPKDSDFLSLSGPGHMGSRDVLGCAMTVACFRGRNPTKMEFLEATGFTRAGQTRFDIQKCVNRTDSPVPLPAPVERDGQTRSRGLRCIAGSGLSSPSKPFAWCSFDTVPASDLVECADIPAITPDNCARNMLSIHLDRICSYIDAAPAPPATEDRPRQRFDAVIESVYTKLKGEAVDPRNTENCTQCHTAFRKEGETQCYKFPFTVSKAGKGVVPLCPLRTVEPVCERGEVLCRSNGVDTAATPKCSLLDDGKTPQCREGAAACSTGESPVCKFREPEIVAGSNRKEQPLCYELQKIGRQLHSERSPDPSMSPKFVRELAKQMCTTEFVPAPTNKSSNAAPEPLPHHAPPR